MRRRAVLECVNHTAEFVVHDAVVISRQLKCLVHDFRFVVSDCAGSQFHAVADVKGQESVKRALEVAASGGHNLIMIGSPGSGKSMMAKCMPSILPPLSLGESLETTKIHSIAGKLGKTAH